MKAGRTIGNTTRLHVRLRAWLGNHGGFGKIVSGPSRTDFSTPSSMKVLWTEPIPLCASASLLPGRDPIERPKEGSSSRTSGRANG